jgi:hypothetical protein
MALRADAQGFLVGDPIDLKVVARPLEQIREDIRAIKSALLSGAPASSNTHAREIGRAPVLATPRSRGADGRFISSGSRSAALPRGRSAPKAAARAPEAPSKPRTPVVMPASRKTPATMQKNEADARGIARAVGEQFVGRISSRVAEAVRAAADMEEADPAVKAMKEVAQPISRGWNAIFGDRKERKQDGWFRRILGELKGFRKEESVYNREANRRLREIEQNSERGGSAGGGGLFSWFSGGLKNLGLLGRFLGGGALRGGRFLRGLLRRPGLLRRIPVLGPLLGLGLAGSDIYSIENDPSLTPEQKRAAEFRAGGKLAGGLLGGALGAFGGPLGAVFGATVGDIVGEQFGGWLSGFDWKEIGNRIATTWNNLVVEPFSAVATKIESAWDSITERFNAALELVSGFLKDKLGIDLPEIKKTVETAAQSTADAVNKGLNAANEVVRDKTGVDIKAGVRKGVEAAKRTTGNAIEGVKAVKDWMFGAKTSTTADTITAELAKRGYTPEQIAGILGTLQVESGLRADAIGDNGTSFGLAQWHNDRWKGLKRHAAKMGLDPSDTLAQIDFLDWELRNTNQDAFSALQTAKTPEEAAIAMLHFERPHGYTKNNPLGADSAKRRIAFAKKAYAQIQPIEETIQPSAAQNAPTPPRVALKTPGYPETSAAKPVENLAQAIPAPSPASPPDAFVNAFPLTGSITATAPRIVSAPAPTVPKASAPPVVAEAQPVPVPLGGSSRPNLTVTIPPPEVGQDVKDRGIAHIATGGISRRT